VSYFYTSAQRRGVFLLLFLLSLLVIYRFTKDAIVGSNSISVIEIQHLKAPILNNDLQQFKKPKHIFKDRDPNNWDSIDWESIGLSKNQVQTLLNYKDAIGGFKKKKDLYKCYVLNEFHKNKLDEIILFKSVNKKKKNKKNYFFEIHKSASPNYTLNGQYDTLYYLKDSIISYYLSFNLSNINQFKQSSIYNEQKIKKIALSKNQMKFIVKQKGNKNFKKPLGKIKMNVADTTAWMTISGIGPKRARTIVNYRNQLGGFVNKSQLLEVFGISQELFDKINPLLEIDSNNIAKININNDSKDTIKKHPYFNWNLANAVVNYRDQHGVYKSLSKIKEIHLVNDDLYRKIAPYISIN
tara:strand:- start:1222 stop:2283 length:1062 start_codon:yes stop_codon:yes gene_type:complete